MDGTDFTKGRSIGAIAVDPNAPGHLLVGTAVAPGEAQWAEGVKKAGSDPKQVMDALKASLVKYKSGL